MKLLIFLKLVEIWCTVVVKQINRNSSISINIKSRYILCNIYSTRIFTIIHVDAFHWSKGDFPVTCAVTLFKIWNHCSKFDHCNSLGWRLLCKQHKTLSSKKRSTFSIYLSIILTLFILSTLFDKDHTRIYICSRNVEHCYSLPIISMEKVNLNYSAKNIPIPSKWSYLLKLKKRLI